MPEDLRVGLRAAERARADGAVDLEGVVPDELVQVAAAVRHEPELEPVAAQLLEHGQRILVERELVVGLPHADQIHRAGVRSLGVASHPPDDLLGERDPDLVVVLELRMALERRVRGEPGRLVPLRVERQAVPLAEPPVSLRAELGTGQREGEVDVEEDGPDHGLRVA